MFYISVPSNDVINILQTLSLVHTWDANANASANANDVHTSNADARKVSYTGAVEVFFQDGG